MNMPVNAFDVVVLAVLVAGILTGRKRGMSEELLGLIKWIVLVVACALLYKPLGNTFAGSSKVFSLLACYLMAYVAAAMAVSLVFSLIKRSLNGKLLGSDFFGRAEYYLGMGSGLVRFGCVLLCVLALLNARGYNSSDVRAMESFQQREFGSVSFPTLHSVQSTVFDRSLSGPWIRQNFDWLLIERTRPEPKGIERHEFSFPEQQSSKRR